MKGIEVRHQKSCQGDPCSCHPHVRAWVKDPASKTLVRKSFGGRVALESRIKTAASWRKDALKLLAKGQPISDPTTATVAGLMERFLAGADRGAILSREGVPYSSSTLLHMRSTATTHLLPIFGRDAPDDVSTLMLRDWIDGLLEDGLAPSSIRNAMKPMSAMYRWAVARELTAANPCVGVALPQGKGSRDRIATPDEATQLLGALKQDRALWALAFYAGLRRGEALGLHTDCIDLGAQPKIMVRDTYHPETATLRKGGKTKNAKRTLPIPPPLASVLREHMLATGRREGYLFGPTPTTPWEGQWSKVLGRAYADWKVAGLTRINYHECRHTYASWLIRGYAKSGSVDLHGLTAMMGHGSVAMTMDLYGHLMPDHVEHQREMLDSFLEGYGA